MSLRVLKKLQGGDLELKEPEADSEHPSEDEELETERSKKNNFFDLLNQQSLSESEVKEDDNETENPSASVNLREVPSGSKKKKKKRKKKTKYTGNHVSSEDNEVTDATKQNPKLIIEEPLFAVELKNLNPENEMRRTFGKAVVKTENKRGRPKLKYRSTYMVTIGSWVPAPCALTMKVVSPPENAEPSQTSTLENSKIKWFAFEYIQHYQNVQNLFLNALERTDSDSLIDLLKRFPYHVDSLIQLSELCKMTDDYSLASELIERAVLFLEITLHPSFSLTSGNCRLDYRRKENRSFFIVLFKRAQYLEARACCRTAFEISKLILNLSPDVDPLAMVLILDYYALRSEQYSWLVKFYEEYDAIRNLSQLPNMAYSYALALYCLEGESEKADKALQYALLMFPGVLKPLLDALSVQTDKRILGSSYFNSEVSGSQSPALHQLVCLYICRAKVVWRNNNILQWLERNVNTALDRITAKDKIIQEYAQKRSARYVQPPRPILRHVILSDYKEKVPLAPFLAKEKEAIMMYDPLPPHDSINSAERKPSSSSPNTGSNHSVSVFFQSLLPSFNLNNGGAAIANPVEDQQNVIANVQQAAAAQNGGNGNDDEVAEVDRQLQALNRNLENAAIEGAGEGTEAGATYRELTDSLSNMVDAMRDFLQHLAAQYFHQFENVNIDTTDDDEIDENF